MTSGGGSITIQIRSQQHCTQCNSRFKPSAVGLGCPNGCGTIPTNFCLQFRHQSTYCFEYGFRSYGEALDRGTEIKHLIKSNRLEIENYIGTQKKTDKKFRTDRVINEYLEEVKETVSWDGEDSDGIAPGTWVKIEQHLKEFAGWCMKEGTIDIRLVKTFEARNFVKHLKKQGNGGKTINNKTVDISLAFKRMRKWYGKQFVPELPEFERLKTKTPKIIYATEKQQQAILEHIPAEHKPIFEFMYNNGLRPAEARALKWENVKRDTARPHIEIKMGFSKNYHRKKTKTGNEWLIPILPKTEEILNGIIRTVQTDFVFYWQFRGKHIWYAEQKLRKICREAREAAGIEIKCYQATRHSFVTQALEAGADETAVSKLVGHKSIQSIKKYDASKRLDILAEEIGKK